MPALMALMDVPVPEHCVTMEIRNRDRGMKLTRLVRDCVRGVRNNRVHRLVGHGRDQGEKEKGDDP